MTSRLPLLLLSSLMLLLLAIPASAKGITCDFSADPDTTAYFNPKEIGIDKSVPWQKSSQTVHVSGLPEGAGLIIGGADLLELEGITSVDGELGGGLYGFYVIPTVNDRPSSIGCQTMVPFREPVKSVTVFVSTGPDSAVQALFDDTEGKEKITFKMTTARPKVKRNADGDITSVSVGLSEPGIIAILIG